MNLLKLRIRFYTTLKLVCYSIAKRIYRIGTRFEDKQFELRQQDPEYKEKMLKWVEEMKNGHK